MNRSSEDYVPPVFNAARLEEFSKSGNCPERYRGLSATDLWNAMGDPDLRMAYVFYTRMLWLMERGRRRVEARGTSGVQLLQARVRRAEAMGAAAHASAVPPPLQPAKSYARLFADTVNPGEWSPVELEVRKMFLADLEKAKRSGGCTGCKRGRLVARYADMARRLASDAADSRQV